MFFSPAEAMISLLIRFMANTWANSVGKHEDALLFLKAGLEANPSRCDIFY